MAMIGVLAMAGMTHSVIIQLTGCLYRELLKMPVPPPWKTPLGILYMLPGRRPQQKTAQQKMAS